MSRYIDADELIKKIQRCIGADYDGGTSWTRAYAEFIDIIDEEPTADVVEVIPCKDCKFRKIEFGWNGKRYKMCANTDYPTDDDDYCSYGERRTE